MGVIIKTNLYKEYPKNASNASFRQEDAGRESDSATTSAQELLRELARAGFAVARAGENLGIGPKDRVTPAVLRVVKGRKAELLRYLDMEAQIVGPTPGGEGGRLRGAFAWLWSKEQKDEIDDEYERCLPVALSMLDVYEKACEMGRAQ